MDLNVNAFTVYDKDWALLTAGNKDSFNSMTVSWGGMGTMWGKPIVTVYVRTNRFTLGFMDSNDFFTVSWYPEENKKDLGIMGKVSGRDGDKVSQTSLTPKFLDGVVTYEQATRTLVCKKLFRQEMDLGCLDPAMEEKWYSKDPAHVMFMAEVVEIL